MSFIKVLLLNPPCEDMIKTELPSFINKNLGRLPHLGLLYLVSALRKYSEEIKVKLLDSLEAKMNLSRLLSCIKNYQPDLIGIFTVTHNILTVLKIVKAIKKISPQTHINLGGPHVTLFPQQTLKLEGVDSITVGDGEEAFVKLALKLKRKENLDKIEGVYFKNQNYSNFRPAIIDDLDKLEFPARDLILGKKYSYRLSRRRKIATLVSSRGCPFNCSFCLMPNFKFRKRSLKGVLEEIDVCIKLGFEEVYFVDDTFNTDIGWIREFISGIRRKDICWSFRGRAGGLTEELVKDLRKSNCVRIHFGVEASNNQGLNLLNKQIKVEDITNAFKLCRKYGIETVAYFLIGSPHEKSREQVLDTINFAKKLNPDYCMFNILTIYPKTNLYKQALKKGILTEDYWQKFIESPYKDFELPFWEENITRKDLYKLANLAYVKFYFRIKFVNNILQKLWKKQIRFF